MRSDLLVRSATPRDASAIHRIIDACAADGTVLPRDQEDITQAIPSFVVGVVRGEVVGCAALVTCGPSLAEIRSVAVSPAGRGTGVGAAIISHLISEAHFLRFDRLFLLTRIPEFFRRLGFRVVDPDALPDSFLSDLVRCQKRSLFNKFVMTRSLVNGPIDALGPGFAGAAGDAGVPAYPSGPDPVRIETVPAPVLVGAAQ